MKTILDTFFYQIRTEQIINFRPNETLFNSIEESDDYIKEMDKVEDKVLKWTQAAEETSAKRKWSQWIVLIKSIGVHVSLGHMLLWEETSTMQPLIRIPLSSDSNNLLEVTTPETNSSKLCGF